MEQKLLLRLQRVLLEQTNLKLKLIMIQQQIIFILLLMLMLILLLLIHRQPLLQLEKAHMKLQDF